MYLISGCRTHQNKGEKQKVSINNHEQEKHYTIKVISPLFLSKMIAKLEMGTKNHVEKLGPNTTTPSHTHTWSNNKTINKQQKDPHL